MISIDRLEEDSLPMVEKLIDYLYTMDYDENILIEPDISKFMFALGY
jgi:hypothetical protein